VLPDTKSTTRKSSQSSVQFRHLRKQIAERLVALEDEAKRIEAARIRQNKRARSGIVGRMASNMAT